MKSFKQFLSFLTEKKNKGTVVTTFGRFNPPSVGHSKLFNAMETIAKKEGANEIRVYASHSQDPKKNPLSFDYKMAILDLFIPGDHVKLMNKSSANNPFDMIAELAKEGFENIILVAGSDRIAEYQKAEKYALADGAKTFKVVSAGERDPDAEGAEGMSASKLRAAAAAGDFDSFKRGVGKPEIVRDLYQEVRKGMGIK